jgi:uncharacterized membrane protein YfcA
VSLEHLLAAACILLFAYFVRGLSGFGSGLMAVPLLALFMPLTQAVPLVLLLDFTASIALGSRNARHINLKELAPLLPFGMIGVVLGANLLLGLPARPLLITLAVFVAAFGLRNLLGLHGDKPISRLWAVPAGLTGGTVGAMFGTGGPPYVIYLSHRMSDKSQLRATFSALFIIDGGVRIVSFLIVGLLHPGIVMLYLSALPLMAAGLYAGSHAHVGIAQSTMLKLIGILLVGSSISLLVKAFTL